MNYDETDEHRLKNILIRDTTKLICFRKLSLRRPGKYRGGGPRGKTFGCCRLLHRPMGTGHPHNCVQIVLAKHSEPVML